MATVLMPIPNTDFDPTETAVPWRILTEAGHHVRFATPDGRPGRADDRMLRGTGLGPLAPVLAADHHARDAYARMTADDAFHAPLRYEALRTLEVDALILPGGHAKGMRPYLESPELHAFVAEMFRRDRPVGAICHGVIVAARARGADGRSVLWGRRTTGLTRQLELTGWGLTCLWLGDDYLTYPVTVQDEVTAALARPEDFVTGPRLTVRRDAPGRLSAGFIVQDGRYLSARWPGDAHRFATAFLDLLAAA